MRKRTYKVHFTDGIAETITSSCIDANKLKNEVRTYYDRECKRQLRPSRIRPFTKTLLTSAT